MLDHDLRTLLRVALSLLLMATLPVVQAQAQAQDTAVVTAFQPAEGGEGFRIEIHGTPPSEVILLSRPDRVALDFTDTLAAVQPPAVPEGSPVASIRDGLVSAERYRILFALEEPAVPLVESTEADGRTVLVIRFEPATRERYAAAAADRTARAIRTMSEAGGDGERRYTVMLDPGHGGADLGAVGEGGTLEKELNLAFAKVLADEIRTLSPQIDVALTREDDTLIPLAERSAAARRAGADLFVSIHADSIRFPDLRGATVYTLSATASDSLAGEVAESENAADRFAGPEWTQDTPEIHDILVDLVRRETESLSETFADGLVVQMRAADIRLINNPKRSAGFRVLMTPDVPSVLLEMGYLSNREDERLMLTPEWQEKTAEVVAEAVASFLRMRSALGAGARFRP